MLKKQESAWSEFPSIDDELKFKMSGAIIQGMVDAERRLVWYYNQPRFDVLGLGRADTYATNSVRAVIEPLK